MWRHRLGIFSWNVCSLLTLADISNLAKFENYKLSTCFASIQFSRRSKHFFSFHYIFSRSSLSPTAFIQTIWTAVIPTHFNSFSLFNSLCLFSLMLHHLQNGKLITHPQITLASTIRNLFVGAVVATAVTDVVVSLLRGFVNNARRITLRAKSQNMEQNGRVWKEEREGARVLQLNASMHKDTDTHTPSCLFNFHA